MVCCIAAFHSTDVCCVDDGSEAGVAVGSEIGSAGRSTLEGGNGGGSETFEGLYGRVGDWLGSKSVTECRLVGESCEGSELSAYESTVNG